MNPMIWLRPNAVLRASFFVVLVVSFAGLSAQRTCAGLFTLVDENSTAIFDTDSQANAFNWTVDGVDQLFQQAFWYRIGNVAETSLDTLPHPVEGIFDTNFDGNPDTLFVRYSAVDFRIDIRYVLDGGLPGSMASDMAEQISVSNLGQSPLDFHFFQYVDFDLNNTPHDDTAVFSNPNTVLQSQGPLSISETVTTPAANHREIALVPVTLNSLNDGVPTTLSDSPAIGTVEGPGDMGWAFQWDFVVQPGQTFLISKDKRLQGVIPEPTAGMLLSLGIGLLLAAKRKR